MKRFKYHLKQLLLFITYCSFIILINTTNGRGEEPMEPPTDKQIVGWIEVIRLFPGNLPIRAKLDTGAKYSSLNASRIEKFSRADNEWVRFSVTNKKGKTTTFEEKVIRFSKIKEHKGAYQVRPVIKLWFCVGEVMHAAEVNLVDRSNFNYQVLIGRSFLKGKFIVDPEKTFTSKATCRPREIGKK